MFCQSQIQLPQGVECGLGKRTAITIFVTAYNGRLKPSQLKNRFLPLPRVVRRYAEPTALSWSRYCLFYQSPSIKVFILFFYQSQSLRISPSTENIQLLQTICDIDRHPSFLSVLSLADRRFPHLFRRPIRQQEVSGGSLMLTLACKISSRVSCLCLTILPMRVFGFQFAHTSTDKSSSEKSQRRSSFKIFGERIFI